VIFELEGGAKACENHACQFHNEMKIHGPLIALIVVGF